MTPEETVIREWVAAMTTPSGAPLPPSERRAEPLPRRRVLPVVVTLLDIIDELRAAPDRADLEWAMREVMDVTTAGRAIPYIPNILHALAANRAPAGGRG